jgi:putative addiction module killer protein
VNYLVQQTQTFITWHSAIRDLRAKIAIARRIDRASAGNLGDIKTVGNGVSEMPTSGEQKNWQRKFDHEPNTDDI